MTSRPAPRRPLAALTAAAALALVLLPAAAGAQEVRFGLGAGWYQPGGDDFDDTDGGLGYHGSVGLALTESVELDLGAQWSRHDVTFSTDDYDVVALYAEPRLFLGDSGPLRPYLSGRLAWVRQSIAVEGVSRHSTGVGGAGELGVAVALGPSVDLEGGLSLGFLSFGDFETDAGTLQDTDSSGRAVGVRVGLRVRP